MLLTRSQKEQLVAKMTEKFADSKAVILVNFQGLKVKEIQDLKKRLREQGIGFQIVKNTLLKISLKNSQISIEESLLDQPIALVWGKEDEVLPAKLAVDFSKEAKNLKIVGAILNQSFVEKEVILRLAALPGREELYGMLVGSLKAPIYRLVNALQGNLRSLVYILRQYQESKI